MPKNAFIILQHTSLPKSDNATLNWLAVRPDSPRKNHRVETCVHLSSVGSLMLDLILRRRMFSLQNQTYELLKSVYIKDFFKIYTTCLCEIVW
jgi:hypothetical protein